MNPPPSPGRWPKGDEDGSDRAKVCGRFLPEHRVSSEQEHHPQRKGRIVLQTERGVRNHKGQGSPRHRLCVCVSPPFQRVSPVIHLAIQIKKSCIGMKSLECRVLVVTINYNPDQILVPVRMTFTALLMESRAGRASNCRGSRTRKPTTKRSTSRRTRMTVFRFCHLPRWWKTLVPLAT
jgi:hypothetical protein